MKTLQNKWIFIVILLSCSTSLYAMGLRSFVALPVDKGGVVVRFQNIEATQSDVNLFVSSVAYGIDAKQTLLLGMPYRLKPSTGERQGGCFFTSSLYVDAR